jgi:hypothetical protein
MTDKHIRISIFLAFILEVGMITFLRKSLGVYVSPVILFIASLSIGFLGIKLAFKNRESKAGKWQFIHISKKAGMLVTLLIGIIIISFLATGIFNNYAIDAKFSDIFPQVRVLVSRFLNHIFPYQIISEWGYDLFPTYFPLQWLPFSIAALLGFDYRYIALAVLFAGIVFYSIYFVKKEISLLKLLFLLVLPFIVFFIIGIGTPEIIGITIENLIAGYYLILSMSIFSKSNAIRALALVICLMSRYSLIFWVPLYLFIIFLAENRKNAIMIAIFTIVGIILIYGPFLAKDPSIFLNGYAYHTHAALAEWNGKSWQPEGDKPYQIFRGIGFAAYFHDFANGSIAERLKTLQIYHLTISILIIVVLGFIFYRFKSKLDYKMYALAGLKVYLAFFYNFIQIPYIYLFIVPIFVSLPIFGMAMLNYDKCKPAIE